MYAQRELEHVFICLFTVNKVSSGFKIKKNTKRITNYSVDDVCAPIARQQNAFTFQNRHTQAYAYNHSEILDTAWPYPDHQSIKLSKQTITTIYVRLKVNRFCVVLRYQIHILVASFIQSTICIRTTIYTQQQHIKRSERRAECLLRFCFFSSLFIALCFVPANSA